MGEMEETKNVEYIDKKTGDIIQKQLIYRISKGEEVSECLISLGEEMIRTMSQQNVRVNGLIKQVNNKGVDDGE